ncbi:hypothetical protein PF005_g2484 [Phytophthora fragariae]|uniref:Uncharacterized protein n=1 Tax=Phytophthora fragariae TaxID=53985 RepID=A0A6A3ZBZ4_9STRA|nr:hypothetical protein PF005_g2484 [Phytophthora fragariae]
MGFRPCGDLANVALRLPSTPSQPTRFGCPQFSSSSGTTCPVDACGATKHAEPRRSRADLSRVFTCRGVLHILAISLSSVHTPKLRNLLGSSSETAALDSPPP